MYGKKTLFFRLVFFVLMMCFALSVEAKQSVVQKKSQLPLADPFVLLDGDTYYAYGTYSPDGIVVYESRDFKTWKSDGLALNKENTTQIKSFWAPEVYKWKDKYYMYYSGEEHLYPAVADSPKGPFRQIGTEPIFSEKSIDGSVFIDEDGKVYFVFVRFNRGNNIWIAEMQENRTALKEKTLHFCFSASQRWETGDAHYPAQINEGPFICKHNGTYYLTYSGNDYQSPNYGVGVALAKDIMGKWTKETVNPLLQHAYGLQGTGHHALFRNKKGNLMMAFHAHNSENQVHPRLCYFARVIFKKWKNGPDRMVMDDKIIVPICR